jgi:putative FmdB family regulatory protein
MKNDFKPLWKKAKKDSNVPIYDYRCTQCKKEYEYFHSSSQDKIPKCPHCGCEHAKKLVSKGTSHVIKGASAKNNYGLKR